MTKGQAHDAVVKACWEWAASDGYQFVSTPRIVSATGACENVDTLWEVRADGIRHGTSTSPIAQYFFAQTGQLSLEMALADAEKVFTMGSSGRAEAIVDERHLREFTLFEVEGKGNFETLIKTIDSLFRHIDNAFLGMEGFCPIQPYRPLVARSYTRIVNDLGFTWGDDFSHEHEMRICELMEGPVLITHHPDPQPGNGQDPPDVEKFFNMKPATVTDSLGRQVVQSCDLVLPIAGECLGGAVRIHDAKILGERLVKSRMFQMLQARGLGLEQFESYLDNMEKHGGRIGEHFGFGVGIDRVVQYYMGVSDIRLAAAFLVV